MFFKRILICCVSCALNVDRFQNYGLLGPSLFLTFSEKFKFVLCVLRLKFPGD